MHRQFRRLLCASLLPFAALAAQPDRIPARIDPLRTVPLPGSVHPGAQPRYDRGPLDPATPLGRITILARPSPSQQADLEALLRRQRIPSSPDYHRWLTPEQFADRFALSRTDLAKIAAWLESEGFHVEEPARARNWIAFSGTAGQVARTFHAELHRYESGGEAHFANATEASIPASLDGVVTAIRGLDDFHPKPPGRFEMPAATATGYHPLTPADFATIYDLNPLQASGIDGTGVNIAIIGMSTLDVSDVRMFRSIFGLPPSDPQLVLIGPAPPASYGWQSEGLLDLEWAGAVAPGAGILFVYATSFYDALLAAVDRNMAQVISTSYAGCEAFTYFDRGAAQQANAEGITWMASSGDNGAAGCDGFGSYSNLPVADGLAVNLPASIPEVTGVGGTQVAGDVSAYWTPSGSPSGYSVTSYIPETSWNQTSSSTLAATGGGASVLFAKPDWQTGAGVPGDNARDVPDVSLISVPPTYMTVRDGALNDYGGGTSASSPAFAGIVALLNHYLVRNGVLSSPGLGNINPTLYRLAQTAPSAFHDIATGDNMVPCLSGTPNCAMGHLGYRAGPGYDPVTGLGSVDGYQLAAHWNTRAAATVTTLALGPAAITLGDSVQLTATVTAPAGSAAPTGTVAFTSNQGLVGSAALAVSGTAAIATLNADGSQFPVGNELVAATYSGSALCDPSTGSAVLAVAPQSATPGSSVFVSISPNPARSGQLIEVTLAEEAGVATKLTSFTMNGAGMSTSISPLFGSTRIAAFGTLSATMRVPTTPLPPATIPLVFGGADTGGRQWSRQVDLSVLPAVAGPLVKLSSAPAAVQQNPLADPSCPWPQQLLVEERNGFPVQITGFKQGGVDLSGRIDQLFGTSHLPAFGSLQAALCPAGIGPPQTLTSELDGTGPSGSPVSATLQTSFTGPGTGFYTISTAPAAVSLPVAQSGGSQTAPVAVQVGSSVAWTVSVFPSSAATSWLTVSPLSGTGPAQLQLTANAADLASGAYRATLILQSAGTIPQFLEVPVTLVVGAQPTMLIDRIANAASFQEAVAPGMLASVFGAQLAPSPSQATSLPLPLQLNDVSVTVNGIPAPLLYVSPTQLNIQIPYEAGSGPAVLGVSDSAGVASFNFTIAPAAPGIFASAGALTPVATAARGGTLPVFITGEGDVAPFLGTNVTPPASTPVSQLPKPVLPVSVTVGGFAAAIYFIGVPHGMLSTQIDVTIPPNVPSGMQPMVVTVNGVSSPPVNLTVI